MEKYDYKVTLVLPSLNVKSYIKECLESVINQSLKEIEILCIDGGSNDGTRQIIESYAKKDNRIRLIDADKRSYGYQVNLGIKMAKGEYIGIVETDDFVLPTMYKELYEYAKRTDADVVKAPYIEYRNDSNQQLCYYGETLNERLPYGKTFDAKEYGEILAYHSSIWAGLYRKSYVIDNDIFFVEADGAGYVDAGFRIDTCINTDKIAWYPKAAYCYRTSSEDSSTNRFMISVMLKRWKEIHEKFSLIENDYDRYYSPYTIFDEYMNTLFMMDKTEISDEDLRILIDNFSKTKNGSILSSPVLSEHIKNKIISFKTDPYTYYKKRKDTLLLRSCIRKIGDRLFPKGSFFRVMFKKMLLLKRDQKNG